jgi:membrane associated rhomboid family serine protease
MSGQRSLLEDMKHQFRNGGASMRLLFINSAIFLIIQIALVFGRLANSETAVTEYVNLIFGLETQGSVFIYQPWGLITSIFAHFSLWHILFNMLFLYFIGRVFEQLFDNKRLYYTYFVGGIVGGLFEILAHLIFPALQGSSVVVVGASGSIMALFFAVAFHKPQLTVNLFGILPIRIIILAGVFLLGDFLSLGLNDGTAHFAHIGGALLGILSIQNLYSSSNIITAFQKFGDRFVNLLKKGTPSKRMKVVSKNNARQQSDEQYNAQKKERQAEIDRILDKISKSGYDSLSRQEKDFLFNQSKNG